MTPDSSSFHEVSSPFQPPSSQSERPGSSWGDGHKIEGFPSHDQLLRLIRRMKAATSRVVVDRLREEWQESSDPVIQEELQLEKTLWAIVASELPLLDVFAKQGLASQLPLNQHLLAFQNRNILNIDGSIGKRLCKVCGLEFTDM
jgi:hypothetical protein